MGNNIKIIQERSDGGNEFLCRNCVYGKIRSGTNKEYEIWCTNRSFPADVPIKFLVTKCSAFANKFMNLHHEEIQSMMRQAWYVTVRKRKGSKLTLVPPDEAKRLDLYYEH
jgi:hypothetical protein